MYCVMSAGDAEMANTSNLGNSLFLLVMMKISAEMALNGNVTRNMFLRLRLKQKWISVGPTKYFTILPVVDIFFLS